MKSETYQETDGNEFLDHQQKKSLTLAKIKNIPSISQTAILNRINLNNDEDLNAHVQDGAESAEQLLQLSRLKVLKSKNVKSLEKQNLQSSSISSKIKNKTNQNDKIFTKRFSQYKSKLVKSINKLESICEQKFGGMQLVKHGLQNNKLDAQELIQYYAKILPKNSDFPQVLLKYKFKSQNLKMPALRSQSEKNMVLVSQPEKKSIKKGKYNKWYIEPSDRFLVNQEKVLFQDWRTEQGLKSVIRNKQLKINNKYIKNLVKAVKEKFHRQPIFCKYVKMNQSKLQPIFNQKDTIK